MIREQKKKQKLKKKEKLKKEQKKRKKKDKKEKTPKKDKSASPGGDSEDEGDGALRPTAPIATPLADLKTTKKILKVVKKGARDATRERER